MFDSRAAYQISPEPSHDPLLTGPLPGVGGGGGFGKVEAGVAGSRNFLVRTAPLFVALGYNVAIFGKPSDLAELDYPDRIADAHLAGIAAVLARVCGGANPTGEACGALHWHGYIGAEAEAVDRITAWVAHPGM